MTCQRRPGSLHYETKDANTYATWNVDYLKLDSCNLDNTSTEVEIGIMRDALNASGRPIFFSICGMKTNCYTLYIFLLKVVLVEEIH
jgi:alpha-galactosidase